MRLCLSMSFSEDTESIYDRRLFWPEIHCLQGRHGPRTLGAARLASLLWTEAGRRYLYNPPRMASKVIVARNMFPRLTVASSRSIGTGCDRDYTGTLEITVYFPVREPRFGVFSPGHRLVTESELLQIRVELSVWYNDNTWKPRPVRPCRGSLVTVWTHRPT